MSALPPTVEAKAQQTKAAGEEGDVVDALDTVTVWLSSLGDVILDVAATPWSILLLLVFVVIDGFFPPVPSESAVIALASLSMTGDGPPLWAIVPVAAVGAFVGDFIAYSIGTRVPLRRLRWFRSDRGTRTLLWAERTLRDRGGAFILAARYIPIGRVAVNMSAGALGFPRKRFVGFAAIAAVMWSIYSTLLGIGAGAFLHEHPFLAVVVGIVLGIAIGTLIDAIMRRVFGGPGRGSWQPVDGAEDDAPSGEPVLDGQSR